MERALLVNLRLRDRAYRDPWPAEESAAELRELVRSIGVQIAEEIVVERDRPTAAFFMGKGKAEELRERCLLGKANVVILSQDLTFPQQRNLEEVTGLKVIDRTQLILDLFARRARSEEGQVQVELAQLEYLLPRLAGKGVLLSRLGGGIGTRGPGEQKLEVDRRRIRLRIGRLQRELEEIHLRRGVARRKRRDEEIPTVALIGYTNVGKTTLFNALTRAGAVARDQLFTTLDPLARRLALPTRQPVLLSDTVGFLHRLPHHLIESFQATLEEVTEAELLLHLADASSPMLEEQISAVQEVLEELKAQEKPVLVAFNKIDRIDSQSRAALRRRYPESVLISALNGEGLPELLDRVATQLGYLMRSASIALSARDQQWLDRIYRQGQVLQRRLIDTTVLLTARVPHRLYGQLEKAGLIKS
ncbi:MAG: GTPase HflX [Candidatus Omnitrophica bacterium]|nr:GTPase HflX [Candidatus Omnitrophota bacterium]